MSANILRKYMDIIEEANELVGMGKMSKPEARYIDFARGTNQCSSCAHFRSPSSCELVEGVISPEGICDYYTGGSIQEKWGTETEVSPSEKGKYKGKSLEDLRKSYRALKDSGPHKKGSPEFGRMRELAFAIRAKTGWGGVGK